MDILQEIQDIWPDLILFWYFFLRCNKSEGNLDKYLDPTVLPKNMGKIMEILNNFISVVALWQSVDAISSKIPHATGIVLLKENLSS